MPTSRALVRGKIVASASGVAAAAAITTGGLRRSRRRSNGAARPAASTVQAAARMAVERGTDDCEYNDGGGRGLVRATRVLASGQRQRRADRRPGRRATPPNRGRPRVIDSPAVREGGEER